MTAVENFPKGSASLPAFRGEAPCPVRRAAVPADARRMPAEAGT